MLRTSLLGALIAFGAVSAQAATWTFTTCGASGALGPDQAQCDAAYGAGTVVVSGGIQTWTVPATGTYRITATGAQGAAADVEWVGGRGARIEGDLNLTAGQTLKLVVGQQGAGQSTASNGGGGGGSFVVTSADVPLLVAGGGGGTRNEVLQNGCNASVTEYAIIGSGGSETSTCALKVDGVGEGGIVSDSSWGSAGAGFNSDGATDPSGGGTHGGGYSWLNGMLGGDSDQDCGFDAVGGYGGGGAGNGCYGGGGGGGYSGGDGGRVAGGGASYNTGSNPVAAVTVGTGDGSIVITNAAIVPTPTQIPTLSEWGMIILSSLLALGAVLTLRRQRQ